MKNIFYFLVLLPIIGIGQTTSENFVKTITYKIATPTSINSPQIDEANINVTYYDGLGRPIQTIANNQSNSGKDIITYIEYDEFGRQPKDYLPYVAKDGNNMQYDSNAKDNTLNYNDVISGGLIPTNYLNQNPFSEKVFENSPLNRVMQQGAPGNIWTIGSGHEIKFSYDTNTDNDKVENFSATRTYNSTGVYDYGLVFNGYYTTGNLYKTVTKNENWTSGNNNTTEEFKDQFGRIVLKRNYNNNEKHDTNYVYDVIGNLIYVIPPLASDRIVTVTSSQVAYNYSQFIDISQILLDDHGLSINGGGGITITIQNSTISISFAGGWSNFAHFDVANSFPINAAYPIPDMVLGNIDLSNQYGIVIQNNSLKFVDLTPNDPPFRFTSIHTQTLSGMLDGTLFGNTTTYSYSLNTTPIDGLCYQYKYDYLNRLVEKKLPGKQWEFIVYDKLNRVVATGPTYNPFGDGTTGWMITKYDVFGRVAYTAWLKQNSGFDSGTRNNYQSHYDHDNQILFESKISNNNVNCYSNIVNPRDGYILLTVNYYDDYKYLNAPNPLPSDVMGQTVLANTKGMSTGSWVRVLTNPSHSDGQTSYNLYDSKSRVVESYNLNYMGGHTDVKMLYNFAGQVLQSITEHQKTSDVVALIIQEDFQYTPQGRLLNHFHQINGGHHELIAHNEYDELGKLISKNVGGSDVTTFAGLQKVDYGYNIRGWLKKINNTDELANNAEPIDLFAFKINYDDVEDDLGGQIKKLYNGNISETFWRTASDNTPRKYGYQYDNLNRLTYAIYQKPGMPQTVTNSYNESMQYDKNGNITGLQRNGALDAQGQTIQIDDLIYKYFDNSNQLFSVTDAESNPNGFTDDSTDGDPNNDGQDYYYDANGNMIEDDNKSIDYIQYNHLNLPTEIGISNSDVGTIFYIYDANGKKVQKEVDDDTLGTGIVTDYLDGFQYKDDILQFFPTAEGYVNCNAPTLTPVTLADGSIIQEMVDDIGPTYSYVYNYLDHLGNIRLSYSQDPQTGALRIIEENHYYPFGLKHTNYNSDKNMYTKEMQVLKIKPLPPLFKTSYDFKYGGKELQEELGLNNYDFGARNYDPAIGRWMNIDPLAETSRRFSPYTYALNNPIIFIDPDGMQAQGADGLTDDQWINAHGDVNKQDAYKQENTATTKSKALQYALMSKGAYGDTVDTGDWKLSKRINKDSGFKAALYQNGSEYCFAIAGTEDFFGKDGKADTAQLLGLAQQYQDGLEVFGNLQKDSKMVGHLSVTGHSLGGGIAEYIAINYGVYGVTFNAAGLSIFTTGLNRKSNTDAYILGTDPLNLIQSSSILPVAGGRQHYLGPNLNAGSFYNGHSIDHVIEALSPATPQNSAWQQMKSILKSALTPPSILLH